MDDDRDPEEGWDEGVEEASRALWEATAADARRQRLRRDRAVFAVSARAERLVRDYALGVGLSRTECAVLHESLFHPRPELARALGRSPSTMRKHLTSVNRKCGTHNLADIYRDLLIFALERELYDPMIVTRRRKK